MGYSRRSSERSPSHGPFDPRRRSLLVTAAVTAAITVSVVPASASFPDQGPRVLFARAKMPPARTLSPLRGIGALDLFTMKPNGDDQVRVVKTDALWSTAATGPPTAPA